MDKANTETKVWILHKVSFIVLERKSLLYVKVGLAKSHLPVFPLAN